MIRVVEHNDDNLIPSPLALGPFSRSRLHLHVYANPRPNERSNTKSRFDVLDLAISSFWTGRKERYL